MAQKNVLTTKNVRVGYSLMKSKKNTPKIGLEVPPPPLFCGGGGGGKLLYHFFSAILSFLILIRFFFCEKMICFEFVSSF